MALVVRRRSPSRPLAISVRSEMTVGVEGNVINARPVYHRTVPHSEVIAPARMSNNTSW